MSRNHSNTENILNLMAKFSYTQNKMKEKPKNAIKAAQIILELFKTFT